MAALLVYGWWGESRNVTQHSKRENVKTDGHRGWVRRQRAGANPGGPPLLDLWLLSWSMASGVVNCFIDAIFGHSLGPGVSGGALFY